MHRWLGLLTEFVAGTILAIMTVLVFLTVIYRYFLLAPISWGEEMARFLFIALSLFGAAIAMREGAHFRITILAERFPPVVRPAWNSWSRSPRASCSASCWPRAGGWHSSTGTRSRLPWGCP